MVTCELDEDVSGEVLGWKLPAWQSLLIHRVLPSCGGLVVYLTLMCYDFALLFDHYRNKEKPIAALCTIFILFPAIITLVFTLASPPPGLQTELTAYSVNLKKKDLKWIARQFANCLFFPMAAIGRYCYLIFWWTEAVCASWADDECRTKEALRRAKAPSSIELYLFLQAFIHAAPNAVINILDLMAHFTKPDYDKATMQAVSIIVSCMRMSSTATLYRRYEREKLNGKKYPWNNSYLPLNDTNSDDTITKRDEPAEPIYESISKPPIDFQESIISSNRSDDMQNKTNSDLIKFSPRSTLQEVCYDDIYTDSDSGSEYLQPMSYHDRSQTSPTAGSDDEYVRPLSIIERVAPRRGTKSYIIEEVEITPPPVIPAPRPGSIAVWAEKIVENAESLPSWLSAPPRHKYCDEIVQDEPDIPVYVPNSRRRGLEPQDATAALVQYLGWYAFFVSRLLSIAAIINCSIFAAVILLFSHYQIMLLLLIVPQASTVKRGFYVFLAFIYLFCLMEFKVRFRHVRVWHVFWIITCTVESILFTGLWAGLGNEMTDWWKHYVIKVIFISLLLSYMCFMVYFVLLQPKETIIYIEKK
ncbi:unnamed protein product [Diatraea saccharalis]|uniref:XK-related protein n=1 Tax=Diatraea saccharalis TaxID=40085 RepID=A0A9N9QW49_9NEOP|nr:unnamed protein product [Diatraea saccharalis]